MKRIILIIGALFILLFVYPQVPHGFHYQAVVRDLSGNVITDQTVSFRISILEGSATGTELYSEIHLVSTNEFGLANLVIGQGSDKMGAFSPEGWGSDEHFIKIQLDGSGGTNFTDLGTSPLLSVPYAFHAQTVAEDQVEDADADPANEIQQLSIEGRSLSLSGGGGTVSLPEETGLSLPFSASVSTTDPVFSITNSNKGRTMISKNTSGGGSAGLFEIENSLSSADVIISKTNGGGPTIYGYASGRGPAAVFIATNTDNLSDALSVTHHGKGNGGFFALENENNGKNAILVKNEGYGNGIKSYSTGLGKAGYFQISNSANLNSALYASTNGTGEAAKFVVDNAGSGAEALYATSNGMGFTIYSECTSEGGTAGRFEIFNSTSSKSSLQGVTNGTGKAVYGSATHSGNLTNYGGYFLAGGRTACGVWAEATNAEGINYGGHFTTASEQGRAIRGHATNSSGENYGGAFRADGDNSRAVWAFGQAYDYYAAGPGLNYGGSSSIRWKRNIRAIPDPLDKLDQIRGVYFNWDEAHGGQHDLGMVAEEVGKVLPEIVAYEENGIDASGMDYGKLTPLLVEACKALKAELDEVKTELALLKQELGIE